MNGNAVIAKNGVHAVQRCVDAGEVFNATLEEQVLDLQPGDRVVLYTDGVVEAMNERNEEFGDGRLDRLVRAGGTSRSREFVDRLVAELDRHRGSAPPHDDITIVALRVEPDIAQAETERSAHMAVAGKG